MNCKHLLTGGIVALTGLGCHATTIDLTIEVSGVTAFNSPSPPNKAGDVVVTSAQPLSHGLNCSTNQFAMPLDDDPHHQSLRLLRYLQRHDVHGGIITISDASIENGMCSIVGVQIP